LKQVVKKRKTDKQDLQTIKVAVLAIETVRTILVPGLAQRYNFVRKRSNYPYIRAPITNINYIKITNSF
jgi:hypothetical protein